jgi:hypothetical protein
VRSNHQYVSDLIKIEDTALERLWKYFQGNLAWTRERPDEASVILLLYYVGATDPKFAELYKKILKSARDRVLEQILAASRENAIRLEIPAATAAEILHESLLASLLNLLSTRDRSLPLKHTTSKWKLIFDRLLGVKETPAPL